MGACHYLCGKFINGRNGFPNSLHFWIQVDDQQNALSTTNKMRSESRGLPPETATQALLPNSPIITLLREMAHV
jgi:hypothetical protein